MAVAHSRLREEVEAAVLEEFERVGLDRFRPAVLVRRFMERGAGRSTLFRWIDELIDSGRAGQHLAQMVRAAAAERAARVPDPAVSVTAVVRPEEVAGGDGTIAVIQKLQACIRVAESVMQHSQDAEGKPRNVKALLTASEHLRRNLETAVKLQDALRNLQQVERFHAQVLEVVEAVARQHPEAAEAIVARLSALATEWGA